MTAGFTACITPYDFSRVASLLLDDDLKAALAFARQHGCHAVTEGTIGKVEGISSDRTLECFRPKGEPDCLWTNSHFIGPPTAP